jgi:hypothetical protein
MKRRGGYERLIPSTAANRYLSSMDSRRYANLLMQHVVTLQAELRRAEKQATGALTKSCDPATAGPGATCGQISSTVHRGERTEDQPLSSVLDSGTRAIQAAKGATSRKRVLPDASPQRAGAASSAVLLDDDAIEYL